MGTVHGVTEESDRTERPALSLSENSELCVHVCVPYSVRGHFGKPDPSHPLSRSPCKPLLFQKRGVLTVRFPSAPRSYRMTETQMILNTTGCVCLKQRLGYENWEKFLRFSSLSPFPSPEGRGHRGTASFLAYPRTLLFYSVSSFSSSSRPRPFPHQAHIQMCLFKVLGYKCTLERGTV